MIDVIQLKEYIIKPVLEHLEPSIPYSESAVQLLLGTCAMESDMGAFLKQIHGPALSIYQIEPFTHDDIFKNFLDFRPLLKGKVESFSIGRKKHSQLIGNLYYATAIARVKYYRSPRKIPAKDNIGEMAKMWRYDYNSIKGAYDTEIACKLFISKYNQYVAQYL